MTGIFFDGLEKEIDMWEDGKVNKTKLNQRLGLVSHLGHSIDGGVLGSTVCAFMGKSLLLFPSRFFVFLYLNLIS